MDHTFLAIDGAGFIWRGFCAYGDGAHYLRVRVLEPMLKKKKCSFAALTLDSPGPTFRHLLYPGYKSNRKEVDPKLKEDFIRAKEISLSLGIQVVETPGFEADDCLASLALRASVIGMNVIVASQDKDLLQLVNEKVKVFDQSKNIMYDEVEVEKKMGVKPNQVADFLAICGDGADGFKGLPGIGPKTASTWLKLAGSIENLLENPNIIGDLRKREILINNKDDLLLCKKLALLAYNAVETPLEAFRL